MNVHDWALVIFTILAQMSVGSFIILGIVHFFAMRKASIEEADRLSDRALLAIGPVLIMGMIASLFHLGTPLHAYRAVLNLDSSPLSWEILLGVLFAVLGGIFAIMQWRKIATFTVRNIIAWVAAIVGLGLVFSMSQVYMLEAQPAWNTIATPINFFTTTLLLGALAMGTAFVANYAYLKSKETADLQMQSELLRDNLRWIAILAIVLLGIELIVAPLYLAYLATGPAAATISAGKLIGEFGVILALRLALAFIGAGIFGVFLYQNALSPGRERILGTIAYSAFALVLIAEVMGRYLFYVSQVRVGI